MTMMNNIISIIIIIILYYGNRYCYIIKLFYNITNIKAEGLYCTTIKSFFFLPPPLSYFLLLSN